tara:strand:+ start:8416 stop:8805 length:390 start_codon:yes stop_codon:yes gene_type:complete
MKIGTFILGVFFVCCSCTDTNDEIDLSLDGEWILTNVSCFCYFGEDYDFSTSGILFAPNEQKLTVYNDGENELFNPSGQYQYTSNNGMITLENNTRRYFYTIEAEILTLTFVDAPEIADDEVTYTYIRK